jgi:hypothetical protein
VETRARWETWGRLVTNTNPRLFPSP